MITVTREADALHQERWTFTTFEQASHVWIILDSYQRESRPSKRHKFRIESPVYSRLSTGAYGRKILPESEVPLPADVLEEARQAFISTIQIGLWERDYKRR